MQLTKDELILQNADLQNDNATYLLRDQENRKEFAKAFGWMKPRKAYDSSSDPESILPTWPQIFVELGKVLAARTFKDFSQKVYDVENSLATLITLITKEKKNDPTDQR